MAKIKVDVNIKRPPSCFAQVECVFKLSEKKGMDDAVFSQIFEVVSTGGTPEWALHSEVAKTIASAFKRISKDIETRGKYGRNDQKRT